MTKTTPVSLVFLYVATASAWAESLPNECTTVLPGAGSIEGLTGDAHGNFYLADRTADTCRVWKIETAVDPVAVTQVGAVNKAGCRPSGLAFGPDGALYITSPAQIYRYVIGEAEATLYASNVPGANGVAFLGNDLLVSDGTRNQGQVWKAGCDSTFHPNVLCMDNLYVAHPLLEGVDGIALLTNGTILGSVNERNSIVAVTRNRTVTEAFVNRADSETLLRNGYPSAVPPRPLEFPTSPFVSGKTLCTTNADSPRRDNNPNAAGEGPKVSCLLGLELTPPGLELPIR